MDVRFRPISQWPGARMPVYQQKNGDKVFSSTYAKTLTSLERELRHLKAKDAVIEGDFREEDIRLDGWPRSGVGPRTSGVVLSFTGTHGPLRIPCDYFRRWEHNLRAIALHLERLRLANNYGVGEHGEQYRGWKQIEAPREAGPAFTTVESAARFITMQALGDAGLGDVTEYAALAVKDAQYYRTAYRDAASRLHPDVAGTGNADMWRVLQEAKALLDKHHGLATTQEARG